MTSGTAGHYSRRGSHREHRPVRVRGTSERLLGILAILRGERPLWHGRSGRRRRRRLEVPPDRVPRIARRPLTASRLAAVSVLALVACWMTWTILANTGSILLAGSSPTVALTLNSTSTVALDNFAARQMTSEDGNLASAEQSLHKALRVTPLDQQALFLLAEAARRRNEMADADNLLREAGKRSWRNLLVQLALIKSDIGQRHFEPALEHVDAALRLAPDLQYHDNHLLGILAAYALDPEALRSLERFLATAPPWRGWFFGELCKRLVDATPLDAIFASLKTSANPPTHEERMAYIGRLIRDQRYDEARRQWEAELPGGAVSRTSYPHNRDFKSKPDGSPFDWRILARRGAEVRLQAANGKNPAELVAQFAGSRVDMTVSQLLILPPGRYIFRGEVKAENFRAARGLQWRLSCADGGKADLGATDLVTGDMPWTRFSVQIEIPRQGCAAEWLQLEIPARVPSEKEVEGQIRYRALAIDPVDDKSGLQLLWRWSN